LFQDDLPQLEIKVTSLQDDYVGCERDYSYHELEDLNPPLLLHWSPDYDSEAMAFVLKNTALGLLDSTHAHHNCSMQG
jgi:hypothetical protein